MSGHKNQNQDSDINNTKINGTALAEAETFHTFGCDVPGKNPDTPDIMKPIQDENGDEILFELPVPHNLNGDIITHLPKVRLPDGAASPAEDGQREFFLRRITREFFGSGKVCMPDGEKIRVWGYDEPKPFPDPTDPGKLVELRNAFPSPFIRVREGDLVQVTLKAKKNTHTIHFHGIEPTTFNDGVGHTSFEVSGSYTYQWFASQAGIYFYHCHKNTPLHFEMGMYGGLIIDPAEAPPAGFNGVTYPRLSGETINSTAYHVETGWAPDDIDPTWRKLGHSEGLCGEDAGMNDFNPKYFLVSGVPHPFTIDDCRVTVCANVGQTILARHGNVSYTAVRTLFGDIGRGLNVRVIGIDGRRLGGPTSRYSKPFDLTAEAPFLESTTAQRFEVLITATQPGRYPVIFEFRHWITGEILGIAETVITFLPLGQKCPQCDKLFGFQSSCSDQGL